MLTENLKNAVQDRKKEVKAANDAYWERFQFILTVNDDIICQRYFRINGYNRDMMHTEEFKQVMDGCVDLIKADLIYKSFVYLSCTRESDLQLTGFVSNVDNIEDMTILVDDSIRGLVRLSDGRTADKQFMELPKDEGEWKDVPLDEWEVTFKFRFLVDSKPVYERIWDGSQYPKYVRNSVDLSNSEAAWRDKDQSNLYFNVWLTKQMNSGRRDLTWKIIRNICDITSWSQVDFENSTRTKCTYGDKTYYYRPYNKQYVDEWRSVTAQKTRKYFSQMEKYEKYEQSGGLSDGEWNYIERYL